MATVKAPTRGDQLACGCFYLGTPDGHVGGTGYAWSADGPVCYGHAFEEEREIVRAERVFSGYLTRDSREVVTWPGREWGVLATVLQHGESRPARKRYVQVRDAFGRYWYGTGPLDGDLVTLRRYKR